MTIADRADTLRPRCVNLAGGPIANAGRNGMSVGDCLVGSGLVGSGRIDGILVSDFLAARRKAS